jgi:hypothetical protein
MSNIQVGKVLKFVLLGCIFSMYEVFFLNNAKEALLFWILKLLFLLHWGFFLQRDYHKSIDAMKLMNNVFFVFEKHVRKKCSCWMCISEKKKIFIKWGMIKNSTIDAQQPTCSTMFGSKCLLHSCVNDVFYIRIKIVFSQNTFINVFKA